jgi:hypothetical protein
VLSIQSTISCHHESNAKYLLYEQHRDTAAAIYCSYMSPSCALILLMLFS